MNKTLAGIVTVVAMLSAMPLMAADAAKIAVASTARIFSEMQELKDLRVSCSRTRNSWRV